MKKTKHQAAASPLFDQRLRECAACAQETDRLARAADEAAAKARGEVKQRRKEYKRLKKAAKTARQDAQAAQERLQACLDDAFRRMAETLQVSALAPPQDRVTGAETVTGTGPAAGDPASLVAREDDPATPRGQSAPNGRPVTGAAVPD
jgi:exonuclease VII large subunit